MTKVTPNEDTPPAELVGLIQADLADLTMVAAAVGALEQQARGAGREDELIGAGAGAALVGAINAHVADAKV